MLGAMAASAALAKDARVSAAASPPSRRPVRLARIALAAAGVWALCLLAGVAYLMTQPSSGGNVISPRRAVFAAVNAATLTGFEMSWADVGDWSWGGRGVMTLLILAGSVACWLVGMSALARLSGGRSTTERAGPLLLVGVLAAPLAALVGAVGGASFDALSAFANAGLTYRDVAATDPRFWLVLAPLGLLGVLGPTLLVDRIVLRKSFTPNTKFALAATAAGFLACVVLLAGVENVASPRANRTLTTAAALATDARSSALVSRIDALPRATQWALVPAMLLGPAGGGVGGGLKVTTLAVLVIGVARLLRNRSVGRTFAIAAAWLVALAVLFGLTFLALLWALPQTPADRVALLAAGASGNVGLSSGPVVAAGSDAYVLSAAMLLGRVLPWLVLWWSATRGDEPVAVG